MFIRISQAGACPRRIQLEAWGVEGLPPWEGSERAFAEGNLHEPSILEWAEKNLPFGPWVTVAKQMEIKVDSFLKGHCDAVMVSRDGGIIVEAKCLSARGFQELREKGVREAHPQYYTQVQLYLAGLNRYLFRNAYLVARNKDTPKNRMWDMHYERIPRDDEFIKNEVERLRELLSAIEEKREIEPPFNPKNNWQCRPPWCPYTYHCWPNYRRPGVEVTDRSDLITVVEMLQEVNEEIRGLEEFREELKARLLEEAASGPLQVGRWLVQVLERRSERFDTKAARRELPADMLARLLKISTYRVLEVKEAV